MSLLAPLHEIQNLDLTADGARDRSEKLAERETHPRLQSALSQLDAQLTAARTERVELQAEEDRIGQEVSEVAREIEAAEVERYSGKRMNRDEAETHKTSQTLLRDKQASLEEQEMEFLERIESVANRIEEHESARTANLTESEKIVEVIREVESEVAAELERLAETRAALASRVPADVLAAYERVRAQPTKRGRGAATLSKGICSGCHTELPSLVKSRMQAEPEDALIQCPQCRRVLVRG